jgi:MscS family membrane protein
MWEELGYGPLAEFLNENLPDIQFMGMDNWQLLGTALIFIFAWPLAMLAHPELIQDTVSARFEDIQEGNALLRLDAGVNTQDYPAFLAVAEDLNLRVVEIALHSGVVFSGPGQLVQLSESENLGAEQLAKIEATLQQWREEDRLPFPNYGADDMAALKDTLDYPPKGSPAG